MDGIPGRTEFRHFRLVDRSGAATGSILAPSASIPPLTSRTIGMTNANACMLTAASAPTALPAPRRPVRA